MADLRPLRELIYKHEVGRAHEAQGVPSRYDVVVWNAYRVLPPPRILTVLTVDEVQAWQADAIRAYRARTGSAVGYSAAGAAQIIRATLVGLEADGVVRGGDLFDATRQDMLCDALIRQCGLEMYLAGEIDAPGFALRLARCWASLPVPFRAAGAHRVVDAGQSYYAGDGINKAKATVRSMLDVIAAIRPEHVDLAPPPSPDADLRARVEALEARMAAIARAAA